MKDLINKIKPWFFPDADKETDKEIDKLNVTNIHNVSLVMLILQGVSLAVFVFSNRHSLAEKNIFIPIVSVGLSILLCVIALFITGRINRKKELFDSAHTKINVFVGGFFIMLILWGMAASIMPYMNGSQIITFYTVELFTILFVRLRPVLSVSIVISSYIVFYAILESISPGKINAYNFFTLALISAAGAMMNYRMTANYISQKNISDVLNNSLEVIANHDSLTRLQNRYALNQNIPDYLDKEVYVAMGDIDNFKSINDTYGHHTGDDVLKAFAGILMEVFDRDNIYRYGGDEFLIICDQGSFDTFREKLDEVNKRFSRVEISGRAMNLGCSFGSVISKSNVPTEFFNAVMEADVRLYEIKRNLKR